MHHRKSSATPLHPHLFRGSEFALVLPGKAAFPSLPALAFSFGPLARTRSLRLKPNPRRWSAVELRFSFTCLPSASLQAAQLASGIDAQRRHRTGRRVRMGGRAGWTNATQLAQDAILRAQSSSSQVAQLAGDIGTVLSGITALDVVAARAGHANWTGATRPAFINEAAAVEHGPVSVRGMQHPLLLQVGCT